MCFKTLLVCILIPVEGADLGSRQGQMIGDRADAGSHRNNHRLRHIARHHLKRRATVRAKAFRHQAIGRIQVAVGSVPALVDGVPPSIAIHESPLVSLR
jgi:hypothetical protein